MSIPTERFANLSLDSDALDVDMSINHDLLERVPYLQDLLSSFGDGLPMECEPHIARNIQDNVRKSQQHRPTAPDWTISGNLLGTLLQHGTYRDEGWNFLITLKAPDDLAYAFEQKLSKRFEATLTMYDELAKSPPATDDVKSALDEVVNEFRSLSTQFADDRKRRKLQGISRSREVSVLKVALDVLQDVSVRAAPIVARSTSSTTPPRRSTRRTTSNAGLHQSLFSSLIGHEDIIGGQVFMLDALENFSTAVLGEYLDLLTANVIELRDKGAPEAYITRLKGLQALAEDGVAQSADDSINLAVEPKPGSKRPQSRDINAPKRGKKSSR